MMTVMTMCLFDETNLCITVTSEISYDDRPSAVVNSESDNSDQVPY
jgi:hypothetical protein